MASMENTAVSDFLNCCRKYAMIKPDAQTKSEVSDLECLYK